jgi:hypothetical protein
MMGNCFVTPIMESNLNILGDVENYINGKRAEIAFWVVDGVVYVI